MQFHLIFYSHSLIFLSFLFIYLFSEYVLRGSTSMAYITFTMFMCYFLSLSTLDSNSEKSHTGSNLRLDLKKTRTKKSSLKKCSFEKKSSYIQGKKFFLWFLFILYILHRRHLWPALSVLLPLLLFICPWDHMTAVCYGVKRNGFKQRWGLLKEVGYVLISPFSKVRRKNYVG